MTHSFALPENDLRWAQAHRVELEKILVAAEREGEWPCLPELQRKLVQDGDETNLVGVIDEMPRTLGFSQGGERRVVLHLFGIRCCVGADWLLDGFFKILSLARQRYRSTEGAVIQSTDIERYVVGEARVKLLFEVLWREAPFLGSSAFTEDGGVAREITSDIVRYLSVSSIDDYLEIRANELSTLPQFGWSSASSDALTESASDRVHQAAAADGATGTADAMTIVRARWPIFAVFFSALGILVGLLPIIDLPLRIVVLIVTVALGITAYWAWREARGLVVRGILLASTLMALAVTVAMWIAAAGSEAESNPRTAAVAIITNELQGSEAAIEQARRSQFPGQALPLPLEAWLRYQEDLAEVLLPDEFESVAHYYELAQKADEAPAIFAGHEGNKALRLLQHQLLAAQAALR